MTFQALKRSGFLLLGCILVQACTKLGPDFVKPEVKIADTWRHATASSEASSQTDYREWWKAFNDPGLSRVIDLAYAQNVDLQTVALRMAEARAALGIARGNLFPQRQQVGSNLWHVKLGENQPNISTFKYWSYDLGFDALWEIDLWGKYRRAIEAADAKLAATQFDYEAARVSLTAEVAAAYVQLRTFQQRLELGRQNASLQERILRITELRFHKEIASELDVQQATTVFYSTQALISALELGLHQTENSLSTLLGTTPAEFREDLGVGPIPSASTDVVAAIPADILRRRPDIQREESLAAAQSALIGVAEAELYPQLSLRGSIGLASSSAGNANLFDLAVPHSLAAVAGPSLNWPILNYGRLRNNVRVQDARLQQALTSYRSAVLRAVREVEDASIGFKKSREQTDALAHSVAAAKRAVELSLLQYQHDLEDFTSVLNSQLLLVQQQDKLMTSQGDAARNLIAMYKAMGGGWDWQSKSVHQLPENVRLLMENRSDWGSLMDGSCEPPLDC